MTAALPTLSKTVPPGTPPPSPPPGPTHPAPTRPGEPAPPKNRLGDFEWGHHKPGEVVSAGRAGITSSTSRLAVVLAAAVLLSGCPGGTHYTNCDAVRSASAAPLRDGDPGYSRDLDRDGDGVACDTEGASS